MDCDDDLEGVRHTLHLCGARQATLWLLSFLGNDANICS